MHLLDNPFHLLEVGPDADREMIEERVEEKLEEEEGERDWPALGHQLLKPKERLKCEVAWLPGLTREQAQAVLRALAQPIGKESGVQVPTNRPLALANTMLAFRYRETRRTGQRESNGEVETVSSQLLRLAETWARVDVEAVTQQINGDRRKGGWRAQATTEMVESALAEHQQWMTAQVRAMLDALPTTDMLGTMRLLADKATKGGRERAPEAIREWLRMYEAECGPYFQEQRKSIKHIARNATQAAKQGNTTRAKALVAHYCRAVRSWDEVAQPMQLLHQGEGSVDDITQAMFESTRELALTLHNEHGATGLTKEVVRMQQEVFEEAEELADVARKDKQTLDAMAG